MPCGILQPMVWGTSVNSLALVLILKTIYLFLPCKLIFWKATKVGSPPNFPKLMSQLWGIPQYFVTSLLEPHQTYFWKHYIYHKEDTKVGSQNLATKFGFVPDWLLEPMLTLFKHGYLHYQTWRSYFFRKQWYNPAVSITLPQGDAGCILRKGNKGNILVALCKTAVTWWLSASSNSIANTLELLQSCTIPSNYEVHATVVDDLRKHRASAGMELRSS